MGKITTETSTRRPGRSERPTAGGEATEILRLKFDLLRSALYHDMRQSSLTRTHKASLFISVVLGSAAIAAFGADYPLAGQASGAAIAIVSAASLVWSFGDAAKDHAILREKFYVLLADLTNGATPKAIEAKMVLIFAEEPPVVHRINKRAHNRAGMSVYGDDFERA